MSAASQRYLEASQDSTSACRAAIRREKRCACGPDGAENAAEKKKAPCADRAGARCGTRDSANKVRGFQIPRLMTVT